MASNNEGFGRVPFDVLIQICLFADPLEDMNYSRPRGWEMLGKEGVRKTTPTVQERPRFSAPQALRLTSGAWYDAVKEAETQAMLSLPHENPSFREELEGWFTRTSGTRGWWSRKPLFPPTFVNPFPVQLALLQDRTEFWTSLGGVCDRMWRTREVERVLWLLIVPSMLTDFLFQHPQLCPTTDELQNIIASLTLPSRSTKKIHDALFMGKRSRKVLRHFIVSLRWYLLSKNRNSDTFTTDQWSNGDDVPVHHTSDGQEVLLPHSAVVVRLLVLVVHHLPDLIRRNEAQLVQFTTELIFDYAQWVLDRRLRGQCGCRSRLLGEVGAVRCLHCVALADVLGFLVCSKLDQKGSIMEFTLVSARSCRVIGAFAALIIRLTNGFFASDSLISACASQLLRAGGVSRCMWERNLMLPLHPFVFPASPDAVVGETGRCRKHRCGVLVEMEKLEKRLLDSSWKKCYDPPLPLTGSLACLSFTDTGGERAPGHVIPVYNILRFLDLRTITNFALASKTVYWRLLGTEEQEGSMPPFMRCC